MLRRIVLIAIIAGACATAGRYEIIIAVGSVRVTASNNGYQTFTTTLDIGAIGITTLDIQLSPTT